MTLKHLFYTATFCLAGVSLATWAVAGEKPADIEVLRGQVSMQDAKGGWALADQVSPGHWIRADKPGTTLSRNGVTVRLEPGADVRFDSASRVEARNGRVCFHLGKDSNVQVAAGTQTYQASSGEFILDAGKTNQVYVVEGDVQATATGSASSLKALIQSSSPSRKSASPFVKSVALDGPDVRKRNRNRRRFTQGEENKGKRIGEDAPPTASPSPTASYTPSPTPSFTPPSPTPTTPPPNNPPPQVTGGGEVWPWVVAPLALGGGIFAIVHNNGGDEKVVRPISP